MFKKLTNQDGFTLIELIMVMIILGILAAVAIPKYASTIEKAEYQYANASDEKTKISALQTLNKIHDSTEKTYARLGLIPNERTGLDVMAEVHTHEELFDIYEECKKEKRESGESGLETKT